MATHDLIGRLVGIRNEGSLDVYFARVKTLDGAVRVGSIQPDDNRAARLQEFRERVAADIRQLTGRRVDWGHG